MPKMNQIEKIRAEIKEYFDPNNLVKDSSEIFISPSEKYKVETSSYRQNKDDLNWKVTKVEIFDNQTNEKIINFIGNDGGFFQDWIEKNNTEYLICAEDMCGGQTVIDLKNRKMSSYSPDEDGFIWTEFHLSPNGEKLATVGCFWACPYVIKVFDFRKPMDLPLTELIEIELLDGAENISKWKDNDTLITDKREISTKTQQRI